MKFIVALIAVFTMTATMAHATPDKMHGKNSCMDCHALTKVEADTLLTPLKSKVDSIKPHPAGMFEILATREDGRKTVLFLTYDKKWLVAGQAFEIQKNFKPLFLHEDQLPKPPKPLEKIDITKAPVQYAVTIGNPKGKKQIFVFTDVDCPYCRQLHPILNKLAEIEKDVAIHIMLMPIPQLHPKAHDKSRTIFTSKSKKILDDAFAGKMIPDPPKGDAGKKEIDAIMKFAQEVKINGTPFIFLGDGSVYNGPRDPEAMKKALK